MQTLAIVLFVISGAAELYAVIELWKQSHIAGRLLEISDRNAIDGGDLDDPGPARESFADKLAKNQRSSGIVIASFGLGVLCGVAGNVVTLLPASGCK